MLSRDTGPADADRLRIHILRDAAHVLALTAPVDLRPFHLTVTGLRTGWMSRVRR